MCTGAVVIIFILLAILDSVDKENRRGRREESRRKQEEDSMETDRMANEIRLERDRREMLDNMKTEKKEHV